MFNSGLLELHSFLRYLILVLFLSSLGTAYYGLIGSPAYTNRIRKLHLTTRMIVNLQALIGLALYFLNGFYRAWTSFGMGNRRFSFFAFGHLLGMLIGIALINIGHQKSTRADTAKAKFKHIATFYSIGTVIIFLMIPWPFFHSWAVWY